MNMQGIYETVPAVYRPYPRRLESLAIYLFNYKGSTFYSSVILRPWVLVRPELNSRPSAWQPDVPPLSHRCIKPIRLGTSKLVSDVKVECCFVKPKPAWFWLTRRETHFARPLRCPFFIFLFLSLPVRQILSSNKIVQIAVPYFSPHRFKSRATTLNKL